MCLAAVLKSVVALLLSHAVASPLSGSAVGRIPARSIARCFYATQAVRLSVMFEVSVTTAVTVVQCCVYLGMVMGPAFSHASSMMPTHVVRR
jgi:hypothetical protein